MRAEQEDRQFFVEAILSRILDWPNEALNELFGMMDGIEKKYDLIVHLDEETLAAIGEGLAQAERGEFATEEEIEEVFGRYRAAPKYQANSSS